MTERELQALVAAVARDAGGEPKEWPLRAGDADHLAGRDGRAEWMMVLDDRTLVSNGPATFDSPEFDKLLRATISLVVDYASEPDADVYQQMAHFVAWGARILVIRTVERRLKDWQSYLSARWRTGGIAEIVPVENAPAVSGRLRLTGFSRRPSALRQAAPKMDESQHTVWHTPWGPAHRLTRIASGISCLETATSSCYHLKPGTQVRDAGTLARHRGIL